jgi:hypothetical protein
LGVLGVWQESVKELQPIRGERGAGVGEAEVICAPLLGVGFQRLDPGTQLK